jgi:hypothetical protein
VVAALGEDLERGALDHLAAIRRAHPLAWRRLYRPLD